MGKIRDDIEYRENYKRQQAQKYGSHTPVLLCQIRDDIKELKKLIEEFYKLKARGIL